MKRTLALILAVLALATALCGCGSDSASGSSGNDNPVSAVSTGKSDNKTTADISLPETYEIAATDPHYIIATPDWKAEGYGYGFALNENGNKNYAIVVACSDSAEGSLEESFSTVYNDTFNGILMQNYRARYAEFTPAVTEVKLANGSSALRFSDTQPADDYGTELNCPVYGYGFNYDGVPFIVACIIMDETAVDDAKRDEMKGYVDEMVVTLRAAQ